ncbi:outer membrane lipoprotein-sorting protein [Algoriphagus sp.]|uniref:outer membrane lipoprotein-sorting protein n=1 Tax=Algoriphagus sp. TaxID=1872435 RepID=UPI00391D66E2
MKHIIFTFLGFFLHSMLMGQSSADALTVIDKYLEATAIENLTGKLTYTNISRTGRTQTRTLQQYIRSNDPKENKYSLVLEFVSPADVAGTATLTVQQPGKEDEQWLYLPAVRSSKRISPSKKSDRFMGTEMTYEDLSNYLSENIREFHYRMLGEESLNGQKAFKIEAIPIDGTLTQYGKRHLWIDQKTYLMLRTEFFDQKGSLLKTYTALDIRPIGNTSIYRAHKIELENVQTGNKTEVIYEAFAINNGINATIFTKTWLETR